MNGIHTAFEGTLGQDAELKYTSTGKAILNFSVAVSENRSGGDGTETTWLKCSAWDEDAERLAPVLSKGVAVYCEGKLRLDRWTALDGAEKSGLAASLWTCQPMGQIGHRAPKRERPETGGRRRREADAIQPRSRQSAPVSGWQDRPATEPQIRAMYAIARGVQAMDAGTLEEWCRTRFGVAPDSLSQRQASETIDALKLGVAAGA